MKEKETGKMKNQNNTAQSAGKKSFLQKKNVEISFKRYAIDAIGSDGSWIICVSLNWNDY